MPYLPEPQWENHLTSQCTIYDKWILLNITVTNCLSAEHVKILSTNIGRTGCHKWRYSILMAWQENRLIDEFWPQWFQAVLGLFSWYQTWAFNGWNWSRKNLWTLFCWSITDWVAPWVADQLRRTVSVTHLRLEILHANAIWRNHAWTACMECLLWTVSIILKLLLVLL